MAQDELENIVDQLISAGASDEQINAAVHQYDQAHTSVSDKFDKLKAEPGLIPAPPVLPTIVGALAQNANKARPALALTGKAVQMLSDSPAALGGTLGATLGGMAGGQLKSVGLPLGVMGGATLGATVGRGLGRKIAPAVKAAGLGLERALSTSVPRTTVEEALTADSKATAAANYAQRLLRVAGPKSNVVTEAAAEAAKLAGSIPRVGTALKFSPARKVVNTVTSRILPGVGTALMVADAANTGYKTGKYIDETWKPGGRKPSDWVGRTLSPLFGGDASTYDAMVKALAEQEQNK